MQVLILLLKTLITITTVLLYMTTILTYNNDGSPFWLKLSSAVYHAVVVYFIWW